MIQGFHSPCQPIQIQDIKTDVSEQKELNKYYLSTTGTDQSMSFFLIIREVREGTTFNINLESLSTFKRDYFTMKRDACYSS